jgi:hypothetical protein
MVPPITNSKWEEIVMGKLQCHFKFLAAKMLMGRILVSIENDPSSKNIDKCIYEIYTLFFKNEKVAREDLVELFGSEMK